MGRHWTIAPLLALAACASSGGAHDVADTTAPRLDPAVLLVEDLDGGSHDLAAALAEETPVAFVFWQTWCASCLAEAPHVAEAARALEGRVQFVGVIPGPDERVDDEKARAIAAETHMDFPHVRDRELALSRAFDVQGTPTIVVLRPDGTVGYRGHGLPASYDELR